MTLRPLSFLSEWVLIRSCGRVVLRLSLQQWTVISLQWKYSSWSWAIHHIWNWTKKGKSRQLNYSEVIYTCYYAFLCMKIAVFFDHLDDPKESKNPWPRCFAQYKRHSVLCWTGALISIVDWRSVISVFLGRMTNPPPCPPPARTRMDQGVLSRSKVDITSKFSCFLVFGWLPCFISFSGHFGFLGWDDPSGCRTRLWPWAQPRSCENPVGKGKTRQSCKDLEKTSCKKTILSGNKLCALLRMHPSRVLVLQIQ